MDATNKGWKIGNGNALTCGGLELSELASWEGSCQFSAATNFSARWTDGDVTGLASQRDARALLKIFDLLLCIASKRLLRRSPKIYSSCKGFWMSAADKKSISPSQIFLLPRPPKAIQMST
jgi:hypothetical protein